MLTRSHSDFIPFLFRRKKFGRTDLRPMDDFGPEPRRKFIEDSVLDVTNLVFDFLSISGLRR